MCGIAGLLNRGSAEPAALVATMTDALRHRGPDAEGVWADPDAGIALGHRRLMILELSSAGSQPMQSADGRYVITYNGEIYNHLDLRAELESARAAPDWRGHSDTETLLAAIVQWGVPGALERAHGMFALAVWDRADRQLYLARDRFGEKPLYYAPVASGLAFASELKAIRVLPGFDDTIDRQALRAMLGRGYVPPERSIFAKAAQVPPGSLLIVSADGTLGEVRRYYDYARVVANGAADPISSLDEALEALQTTLGRAVERQLTADVPVGTLLSGGIDSSLITALAARHSPGKIRTFSIGFAAAGYDEAPHARAVAAHLGTDHHELYLDGDAARRVIPSLPKIWDEPFGDSSQLPTYLVSRFAREQVTVALSGDAGDELFGGYQRHRALPALTRRLGSVPPPFRAWMLGAAAAVPPSAWNKVAGWRSAARPAFFGHKVRRALRTAQDGIGLDDLYQHFLDDWYGEPSPLLGGSALDRAVFPEAPLDPSSRVMLADALGYLPGDILTKVDRAGMAVSLEGRVPFLDPEVAALAARIPIGMKIDGGKGKAILRRMLAQFVPPALFERPKAGFAIPLADWLTGPLREWCEELLHPHALEDGDLLDARAIRARWDRLVDGREDASQALWSVLMFQAWRCEAPRLRDSNARFAPVAVPAVA